MHKKLKFWMLCIKRWSKCWMTCRNYFLDVYMHAFESLYCEITRFPSFARLLFRYNIIVLNFNAVEADVFLQN